MTNKLIIGGLSSLVVVGALAFTPMVVNAQVARTPIGKSNGSHQGSANGGGYQSSLDARAKAVGMTSAELAEALKTKNMDDILAEKKISITDYQAKMADAAKARWQAKGLSAEEIEKRINWQKNRHTNANHDGTNQAKGGYRHQDR